MKESHPTTLNRDRRVDVLGFAKPPRIGHLGLLHIDRAVSFRVGEETWIEGADAMGKHENLGLSSLILRLPPVPAREDYPFTPHRANDFEDTSTKSACLWPWSPGYRRSLYQFAIYHHKVRRRRFCMSDHIPNPQQIRNISADEFNLSPRDALGVDWPCVSDSIQGTSGPMSRTVIKAITHP